MAEEQSPSPERLPEDVKRFVSDAEAEIHQLAQQLHDKITALVGDEHWLRGMSFELKNARRSVEDVIEWVNDHFQKEGTN